MSISGIGGTSGHTGETQQAGAKKEADPALEFLAYMKKSPLERMQETWLQSHGYSKEKLDAMTPEQRAAVLKQMAKEVEQQIKEEAAKKRGGVDTVV